MAEKADFTMTKRTATKCRRGIDFSREMETADTIASVSVTAADDAGGNVSTNLISTATASGTKALWTFLAWGTVGAVYYVRVAATTTQGDILVKVVKLTIEGA